MEFGKIMDDKGIETEKKVNSNKTLIIILLLVIFIGVLSIILLKKNDEAQNTLSKVRPSFMPESTSTSTTNLQPEEKIPDDGVTSPDGKMIAYKKYKNGTNEVLPAIYIYFTESKTSESYISVDPTLASYLADSRLSWSPDNKEIIVWYEGQVYGQGKILVYDVKKKTNIAVLVSTSNKIVWGNDQELIYIEPSYRCNNESENTANCSVIQTTIKKFIISEQKSVVVVDSLTVTSDFYPLYSLYKIEKSGNGYEVYYIIFPAQDKLEGYKINSDGTGKTKL